eukprot:1801269-Prymnesium_polylepis.1
MCFFVNKKNGVWGRAPAGVRGGAPAGSGAEPRRGAGQCPAKKIFAILTTKTHRPPNKIASPVRGFVHTHEESAVAEISLALNSSSLCSRARPSNKL